MKRKQSSSKEVGADEAAADLAPVSLPGEGAGLLARVQAEPADEEAWDAIDELARETERPEGVSSVYQEILARDLPVDLVESLGRRAVAFHDEWFEDPSHVIRILLRVLALAPGAEWAFERLSLLLTMAERWEDLLAAYDLQLASSKDPEKKKLLLDEAARIAKDFAGSTDRAIGYLKQLVPLRPEDAQLAQSLERRLVLQKRYRDLIDVWAARLSVLSPAELLQSRVRIAETWLDRLSEAGTALGVVREILEAGGGEKEAAKLLERIGSSEAAPLDVRQAALLLLKARLSEVGRSEEVVRAIELLLGVVETSAERIALRSEATRRLAELEKFDAAVLHAAEWLVLEPRPSVQAELSAVAARAGRHDRYAEALVRAARVTPDAAVRIGFLTDAARVNSEELGMSGVAIQLYTEVMGDASVDDAGTLEVARRLVLLLVGPDHEPQRLEVLERLAKLEPDPAEQRRALGEAAELARRLGNTDHALALWARRIERDARDAEALDATVALLEENARWEALVAALERRHDATTDPALRRADLVRVASVHRTRLDDLPSAIDAWRRIEAEFGTDADTTEALADLSALAQRWSDVTQLLRQAAGRAEDPDRRAEHLGRMGDVYRTQRQAPVSAVESYKEALEILPVHEPSRAGLRALLDDPDAGGLAVETLARAHSTAGEWRGLLDLVERRVDRASTDEFRRDVLLEAASLEEHRAEDAAAALGFVRRAFALSREPEVEKDLLRLAEMTFGWAECARGYAEAIATTTDAARRADLLFSHGGIVEKRLSDLSTARASYARVTELFADRLPASIALVRVAGLTSEWDTAAMAVVRSAVARGHIDEELLDTFEGVATHISGWDPASRAFAVAVAQAGDVAPKVLHDLRRRLGIWHRDRREDPDAAQRALREAVQAEARAETLGMLAELERRSPGPELIKTLLSLATATGEDLDVLYEAGTVALHAVHDPALCRPILQRVLSVASERWKEAAGDGREADPALPRYSLWALEQLVQLSLDAEEGAAAVELLENGARLPFTPEKSRELRYRAAALSAELVGDVARAVDLCRGILEEAPDDSVTIALLAGLYSRENRLDELLDLRKRELSLGPPVERRLFLRLDIAKVLGELSRGPDERVAALLDNLGDSAGDPASVDALTELLQSVGRHADLFAELARQAERVQLAGDPGRAAVLWAQAGRLAETPLGEVERAIDAYRRSVALEASTPVLDSLAAIHTARGEHGATVSWLEKRLSLTDRDPRNQAVLRDTVLRLARAYRAAGNEESARRILTEALAVAPAAGELRGLLGNLYRDAEDWLLLAPLLSGGVEHAATVDEKVSLLRQAAQVQRRRLGALEEAIPLLARAAELVPDDRAVRLSLAEVLRLSGRFGEARALLDVMLAEFGRRRTPERARVHYHLARIAQAERDLEQALAHLESASSIERSDPGILKLLGDVAREKGEHDAAERAYRALLLIVRRQQPVLDPNEPDDEAVTASEVLFDLHQMAVDQGQNDRANDLLESAFETAASNNVEALRLEKVLRASGQTDLILRVLDARLERITEPAAAAEILVARADLLAGTGRLGEALGTLLDALGKTPGSVQLLSSARDLAVRANEVPRYVERLSELATAAEATDALLASDLWMRLGSMAENELADQGRAARYYESSLGTGRRALRAYRALGRVVPPNDAETLGRVLGLFVASSDQDETETAPRTEALYRLSEVELGSPESAVAGAAHLSLALDRNQDYDRALPLASGAARAFPGVLEVVKVYERVARAVGGDALLLDALTLSCAAPDADPAVLVDAVELARKLADSERLGLLLGRLVDREKASPSGLDVTWAFVDLAAIREAAGDARGAADLLMEAASRSEGRDRFEYTLRVARLSEVKLGDLTRAAELYNALRREEPADVRIWKPLLEVHRKLGAFAELEACIAETVDAVYDPVERNHLRMERGRILLEDPERRDQAEAVLREVLDEDPDHAQASVLLAEVLERTGRIEELNELLDRQLEGARDRRDGPAVAALTLRIGKNLESEDPARAAALYRESLESAPEDRALLEALLRLYGPEDDARDRLFVLGRLLDLETGEGASDLALEVAALATSLDDSETAVRALRRGFEAAPGNAELRTRLVSIYEERADWEGLAEVIAIEGRSRSGREAVKCFREAAEVLRTRLGDAGRAADLLVEAQAKLPGDIDLQDELIGVLGEAGRHEAALALVEAALGTPGVGPEARARLHASRARLRPAVQGRDLGTLAASVADLDQAVSLVESRYEAELVALLEEQRLLSGEQGDEATERAATMRLAPLLPKVGDQRRGLELLVAWVKRQPNDADAVRGLGQFAANAEKWSAAAKAYQRLVEITEGPDQVDAVVRFAGACERSGNPMDARSLLESVYSRFPGDDMLRMQLRRMYESAGAYAELAAIMIAEAGHAADDQTRFERLVEAGDVSLRVEGGEATAVDAYRQAHQIRPEDHHIGIKLADTLGRAGGIEEAAAVLDAMIESYGKRRSPELSELQHAMARVGKIAGDWEAVFAWLDAAVQTDRQNGAASSELAVIAMERGELDIAIKALQAITLLKGEAPMSKAEAYLRQGMIAEQKGDAKKAVFLGKRALTQDPEYADAKAFLERLGG